MMKTKRHLITSLLFLVIASFVFSGCGKKGVTGQVVDSGGNELKGVSVKIEKSTFSTLTDEEGKYLIDYAPGSFTIIFSKDDYTSHKLELNISNMALFPAETIMMYPIPKEKGIYFLDGNKLIALNPLQIQKIEFKHKNKNYTQYYINRPDIPKSFVVKSDIIQFIDTNLEPIRFARLRLKDTNWLIERYYYEWGIKYDYNGFIEDKKQRIGEEQILLRSIKKEPGVYCLVGVYKGMMSEKIHPDTDKKAYPFIVPVPEKDKQAIIDKVNELSEFLKDSENLSLEKAKNLFNIKDNDKEYQQFKNELSNVKIKSVNIGEILPTGKKSEALVMIEVDVNNKKSKKYHKLIKIDGTWYFHL
ncbi:MAG: carboxypeptidase-like regulatory domain-containing protein [Candidatus Desulfaltia sp.]|nr:carboxypeptidase-like regulatory domain-containing protein [Candidatus Desulfaltia sp.]